MRMGKRALLLLTVVVAMLLACSGLVLAQSTTPGESTSAGEPTDQQSSSGKAPLQKHDPKSAIPDQYIVVLKDSTGDPDQVAKKHAKKDELTVGHTYKNALKGYVAKIPAQKLDDVRSEPEVQFVSEDREVNAFQEKASSEPSTTTQESSKSPKKRSSQSSKKETTTEGTVSAQEFTGGTAMAQGDSGPTGVRRIEAASNSKVHNASDVNVAVIDTGIDLTHRDLNASNGKNCVKTSRQANDDNGHGTHVSGTIGAKNNGSGVVGVAPGTKLYAVKVLNSQGSGSTSQVICGIDWVTGQNKDKLPDGTLNTANDIKVVNMSLGGGGSDDGNCGNTNSDAEHKAICRSVKNDATQSGATYAVAAGNSGTDMKTSIPAAYNEVLAVTAMTDSDGAPAGTLASNFCRSGSTEEAPASFSNYAGTSDDEVHTIAGPGVCIRSTWKGGSYNTISGTSMATPHLAGTAALCIGSGEASGGASGPCAGLTPAQIIQTLRSDAQAHSPSTPTTGSTPYGFTGDPNTSANRAGSGKYFGYLTWDGNYPAATSSTP